MAGSSTSRHVGTRGMPRAERESQILAAALAEFGERGYHQVSVDAIASRAGISKPLIHAYFGTKDALYARCVEQVTELLLERIVPVVENSEPGLTMAIETMRVTFEAVLERPGDWMLAHDRTLPEGSEAELVATACREQLIELGAVGVRTTLQQAGRQSGDVDPLDVDAMNHVWQAVVTAVMTWWYEHPDQTPDQLTDRFARLLAALVPAA